MGTVTISTEKYDRFKEQERVLRDDSVVVEFWGYGGYDKTVLNANEALRQSIEGQNNAAQRIKQLELELKEAKKQTKPFYKFWQ